MQIKRLAIIGLGLIGASLAKAIKHIVPTTEIAAFDYPDILEQAVSDKTIDVTLLSYYDALEYDHIFLAFPIEKSIEVFKTLSPSLKKKSNYF